MVITIFFCLITDTAGCDKHPEVCNLYAAVSQLTQSGNVCILNRSLCNRSTALLSGYTIAAVTANAVPSLRNCARCEIT